MKKYPVAILLAFIMHFGLCQTSNAANTSTVAVSATVISKNNCRFTTATAALAFGTLEVANPVDKTVNTSIIFRCGGSMPIATYFISDDDGLYETGVNANRMRHTTLGAEYIPYTFTLSPRTGNVPKNTQQQLTITGTVYGFDYKDAAAGDYSDSVIITIVP
jgi:hypothetical protein